MRYLVVIEKGPTSYGAYVPVGRVADGSGNVLGLQRGVLGKNDRCCHTCREVVKHNGHRHSCAAKADRTAVLWIAGRGPATRPAVGGLGM